MKDRSFLVQIKWFFRLFLNLGAILLLLQSVSCRKNETDLIPLSRSLQVWLHRCNTIDKAQRFQYAYTGLELDVHFDTVAGTFIVKHDASDTSTLTLSTWLSAITDPGRLGFWLDFKNLSSETGAAALAELRRIRQAFNLTRHIIVVESWNPPYLPPFDTLNFRISFYIPVFDPSLITPEEELAYRDYIFGYVSETGIETISGYYVQHSFMQKWFPDMNKLLWYLDSYDPAIKDSIIKETRKDPTVEVLLVSENYPKTDLLKNSSMK
jgi:hypothetical protein